VYGRRTGCILPATAPRQAPFGHLAPKPASQPPSAGRGRKFIWKGGEDREDCVGPTLALARPLGHGAYLWRRHPACQAPMPFLAISSGNPTHAGSCGKRGQGAEGRQEVNASIPTPPNPSRRARLEAYRTQDTPPGAPNHPGASAVPRSRPQLAFRPLADVAPQVARNITGGGRTLS
jgi:hypothetical protein